MFGLPTTLDIIVRAGVLGALCLLFILLLVRLIGLRSFSKMTAFDFVITLATGSLLANATSASSWAAFGQSVASKDVHRLLENEPLMLMRDGAFLEDALKRSRVTREDVFSKLRTANVLELSQVRAVVLETPGDISVLHGDRLEDVLVEGVR